MYRTLNLCKWALVTKQRDPDTGQQSLLFQIDYPEIVEGVVPRHRFMSAYEQKIEPPDKKWQYLLIAAEPYETVAFKVRVFKLLNFWNWCHCYGDSRIPFVHYSGVHILLFR